MLPSWNQLRRLAGDEEGLSSTEYAVMLALIIIVCISAAKTLGGLTDKTFYEIGVYLGRY